MGLYVSRLSEAVKPAGSPACSGYHAADPNAMLQTTQSAPISSAVTPAHAIELWPPIVPLAALVASADTEVPFQRYSYLASIHDRLTPQQWLASRASRPCDDHRATPALVIPLLSYELGGSFEPSAGIGYAGEWGSGEVLICDSAYRFDHSLAEWSVLGDPDLLPTIEDRPSSERSPSPGLSSAQSWSLGALASDIGQAQYQANVARAIEYIRAGDIFQVNLAHQLVGEFSGSSRALFADLVRSARPAYAACIDASPGTILSLSPELFLAFDPISRRCVTRPMKGTASAHSGRAALEKSPKDAAELRMIVDLMRNDLSRVCEIGSVRVDDPRAIETHAGGGVYQGVATISGTLRNSKSLCDLIRASFPAGSITGAPKVRAMQIINELEGTRRGPYCGSIGAIDAQGHAVFNVGIRTAIITGQRSGGTANYRKGELVFPVGAGIVADSVPELEWSETLAKASAWRTISGILHGQ